MTPGLIRKAWVKKGPWISAPGRAGEERAASVRRSELISLLWAPCRGRTWCGWIVHTAPGWSRPAAWEGRGSFWSPSSSPVTWGGSRSAFPEGWLPSWGGQTDGETDSKWFMIWASHHNVVRNLNPKHRNYRAIVFQCDVTSSMKTWL